MYGITAEDITFIDNKIAFQKKFLENFSVDFADTSINMLDNTYSANLNPKKYFSEINNRVNTMVANAKDKGLLPVFVTLTAPSKFHRKYEDGNYVVNPNETSKALTQIWNKFTNLQVFQKMKKELGFGLTYFRVYEPHKSGVPHLHALVFLPACYILPVKKKFLEYFKNKDKWGANHGGIGFRYTWYKEKGGAVGYVMKYILKTFEDTNRDSIQHAVYWYIKHKVRRFLTSRTLAPLSVYRKVRYYFKEKFDNDFQKITSMLKHGTIYKSFDGTMINYRYMDEDTGEVEDVVIWSKNADLILHSRIQTKNTFKLEKYVKKEIKETLKVSINGLNRYAYCEKLNKFIEVPVVPSKLNDYSLVQYFRELDNTDLENINLHHYGLVKNEMLKRELLTGDVVSLNNYGVEL